MLTYPSSIPNFGFARFRSGYLLLSLLVGCGGAQPSTSARTAAEREAAAAEAAGPSVGNAYVSEGGIGVLGATQSSAGNALGPPLMARQIPTGEQVKLDGRLTEWPALSPARVELHGKTPATANFALQYDNDNIYVAAEVSDSAVERTRELSLREDHVSLVLAFPNGRSLVAYHLALFTGKSGVTAGAVKLVRGNTATAVAGSKLVEAESSGKTVFEAKVPWTTFAEAATLRLGLRANIAYHDATSNGAALSTGKGDAEQVRDLAQLFTEPEIAVADGLLTPQNLTQLAPSFDLFANVAGDATKERISVYGGYLTVCGPKYRAGHQYFYREYPGEIVGVETKSIAAADREDLLVRRRIDVAGTKRELIEILSFVGDEPATLFTHELAVVGTNQRISNSLHVGRGTLDIGIEAPQGWDQAATSFRGRSLC
jgi:Carbohydrate family 9 binding domain-like